MKHTAARLVQQVAHEASPVSRYSAKSSAKFNFKPKPTQGLIHNPPHAIHKPVMKTPTAFLPASDPRKQLPAKQYTAAELESYPVIHAHRAVADRAYDVTPETVAEIVKLRQEDPTQWTISKLAKKFGVAQNVVNVVSGTLKDKPQVVETPTMEERRKRRMMWLRGEF
ncbi:large ribosomal subunit protein mL58 [Diutina catenulata]